MKKIIPILLSTSFAFAGLYDYPYLANSEDKQLESQMDKNLMYNEFEEIVRFKPLFFNPSSNEITDQSKDYLDEISKVYEKYENRDVKVTIIGYTDHVQTKTEKVNQSSWFRTYENDLTVDSSKELALKYATYTFDELSNKGIPKENMIVEERGGLDNLYTRATKKGQALNYRAMVTLYISKLENADSDNDGVIDNRDRCNFTPKGHSVDEYGCSELLNLTVNYNVNSSVLLDTSFVKLNKVIDFMKQNSRFKVLLYGYTSNEGTNLKNQLLSEKRALSIRTHLMKQGISSSRISIFGKAAKNPIKSNDTKEGREANRRVEIKLY